MSNQPTADRCPGTSGVRVFLPYRPMVKCSKCEALWPIEPGKIDAGSVPTHKAVS